LTHASELSFANALVAGIDQTISMEAWLAGPLSWIVDRMGCPYACVVAGSPPRHAMLQQDGDRKSLVPWDELAHDIESRHAVVDSRWACLPIPSTRLPTLSLILSRNSGSAQAWTSAALSEIASAVAEGVDAWHLLMTQRRDVKRLTEILEIAADWHAHRDLDRLLADIAQAATRLLDADRASIFLWDKAAKQLVGHPALGVEGKPLRIPEDSGVAGQVLKSLQARRWDRSDPADEVYRHVDVKVGYRTDSLVAVPMLDQRGKPIGVFEVLNQRRGSFSVEDESTVSELARHAAAALVNTQQIQQLVQTRERMTRDAINSVPLLGHHPSINALKATIDRVAPTDLAVLLLGENGTGKEVASRRIHYQSPRKYEPFIAVNCAALTESLLESELFGHEKGAFTDAHEARAGKFEIASGGTLFLDEIGDMSSGGQAKLLRVLEEKVVVRVGGSNPIPVDVRVIAATNQDLVALVEEKKFREDLYFRLTVVTLHLPPLRQRGQDVIELAEYFLESFCTKIGRIKPSLSSGAQKRLVQHAWPGNIRELRNLMERLIYLLPEATIEEQDIDFVRSPRRESSGQSDADLTMSLADATDRFQIRYIEQHIVAAARNMTLAAQNLGLQRSNLYRKMKQLGMETDGD
jgi:Nif-specific regulatory protein